jgi:parallel beta-helix repeat protein/putative cofactor-binding repeat protein
MADPITWYLLGRTVEDTESISEEIDAKLLTHNLDPSAHGQENEVVYEHRVAPLLDHLQYTIYNIKLNPASRVYKAIVAGGGEGDFTTLQSAIDWANLHGGGIVYIKAGTYVQNSDITLYSNIEIIGEDNDTVILDFNEGAHGFRAIGTSGAHKKNIRLRNIQIKDSHYVDEGALRMDYIDDSEIENVYFLNNYDAGGDNGPDIYLNNSTRVYIRRCHFKNGHRGVYIKTFSHCLIAECHFEDCKGTAVQPTSGNDLVIRENLFESVDSYGIYCDSAPVGLSVISNTFITQNYEAIFIDSAIKYRIIGNHIKGFSSSYNGIYLAAGSRAVVVGNVVENFGIDGIRLSNQDYCTITGNICTGNTGYGIKLLNATCDKNIVVGNNLIGNDGGGLSDGGTATDAGHNILA